MIKELNLGSLMRELWALSAATACCCGTHRGTYVVIDECLGADRL